MDALRVGAVVVALSAGSAQLLGQPKYAEPWDPVVEAAAARAVAALSGKTSLAVNSTIVSVPELASVAR